MTDASIELDLHPRQGEAFNSEANEILYGGAAGGGKSHLIRVLALFLAWMVPGIQIYIIRRIGDDLVRNHMEGAGGFFALLSTAFATGAARYNASTKVISFKNGSKIWLCHCQYEKNVAKFHGPEIHALFFDELTHFTEYQYRFIRARCRLGTLKVPDELKHRLPLVLSGSNPGSSGHSWVKTTFVDPVPPMEVWKTPKTEGGMRRQFIPARLTDNPSLNQQEYADLLAGLGSPELVRAMLDGDWDIVVGGALDDVWDKPTQIVPRFRVPHSWRLDRAFDWGSTRPFSVGWYAVADGTEAILPDGSEFAPPAGSLVRFAEYYGCVVGKANTGIKMPAAQVARNILNIEHTLEQGFWIQSEVHPGPADNSIFTVNEEEQGCIGKLMAREGVHWCRSDKSPGSRINGLQYVREYLTNARAGENPGLYFMDNCRHALSLLPQLPRDPKVPDDVDSKSEDHLYDELRYRILHERKDAAHSVPVKFAS